MKEVYMALTIRIPSSCTVQKEDIAGIEYGGYEFVINGQTIPFDFGGSSSNIEEDERGRFIHMETGDSFFFKNRDIEHGVYAERYAELGIDPQNITAEFLSSATAIESFYFVVTLNDEDDQGEGSAIGEDFILEKVVFMDENENEYAVDESLLGKEMKDYS